MQQPSVVDLISVSLFREAAHPLGKVMGVSVLLAKGLNAPLLCASCRTQVGQLPVCSRHVLSAIHVIVITITIVVITITNITTITITTIITIVIIIIIITIIIIIIIVVMINIISGFITIIIVSGQRMHVYIRDYRSETGRQKSTW